MSKCLPIARETSHTKDSKNSNRCRNCNITYFITISFIAILAYHTASLIMLTNQNIILFVMIWWFGSLVEIITTHSNTWIYKGTNNFLSWSICRDSSCLIHPGDNLKFIGRSMYHHTHMKYPLYDFAQLAGAVEYTDCFSAEG